MGHVSLFTERATRDYFYDVLFERVVPRLGIDERFYNPLQYLARSLARRMHIRDLRGDIITSRRKFYRAVEAALRDCAAFGFLPLEEPDKCIRQAAYEHFLESGDTAIIMFSFFLEDRPVTEKRFYEKFGKGSYEIAVYFSPPDERYIPEILRDEFSNLAYCLREMKREIENDRYLI